MHQLVEVTRAVTMLVFATLATTCLGEWPRHRDQPTGWAVLNFGVLAVGRHTPFFASQERDLLASLAAL